MIGKRIQFHDETWHELQVLASESMKSFPELADEAFNDLLKKHGRPANLKEALRRSAGDSAKVISFARKPHGAQKRKKMIVRLAPRASEFSSALRAAR